MGLLDVFDQSGMDPKDRAALNQGLLSMGLSMMAGKGNLGQVVGQAGLQGMQSYQGARQRQQQDALNAMTMEQHQLALRQAKAQAEAQQRAQAFLRHLPGPQMQAAGQAMASGGGPTMAAAQRVAPVDPQHQQLFEAVRAGVVPLQTYLDATRKDTSPLTVKDNEVLLDRRTFQPLFSNRGEKDPRLPDGMRMGANGPEWIPGYLDGRRSVAQAGASQISMGSPIPVTLPDGTQGLVQPANRPGAAPQVLRDPTTGRPLAPGAGKDGSKPIPDSAVRGMVENRAALSKIDRAVQLVGQNPGAFGAQNYLGDTVQQRMNPQGVEARALVADIGSLKIHDRSGAAVTVGEIARLKPFVPNATDTPQVIAKKLAQFRQEYAQVLADMQEAYGSGNGYRPNSLTGGARPAPQGLPAAESIAAELERRRTLGGR